MAKIDVYLRSIERFGAAGAVLTSGQAVTLKFPQGDRNATQITPHDQLVALAREVAPPAALAQIDGNRPAKFEIESNGFHYALTVTPRPGMWQVLIEGGAAPAAPAATPPTGPVARQPRAATAPTTADAGEMAIERGQYGEAAPATRTTSGSALLDQWTNAARSARATDVYLATGAPPVARVNGELQALGDRGSLEAETISRELGVVAPAEARAAWSERGFATFTYGDGVGRVRATLTRDHRGPGATLRLLVGEPPAIERLGLSREVGGWLDTRGLVLVAGPTGSGKTTTLAALVRSLGDKRERRHPRGSDRNHARDQSVGESTCNWLARGECRSGREGRHAGGCRRDRDRLGVIARSGGSGRYCACSGPSRARGDCSERGASSRRSTARACACRSA
jgi:hypothetical protein